ncbi:MAG: hypothetical protein R3C26_01490 [Calditrichia bacterium]
MVNPEAAAVVLENKPMEIMKHNDQNQENKKEMGKWVAVGSPSERQWAFRWIISGLASLGSCDRSGNRHSKSRNDKNGVKNDFRPNHIRTNLPYCSVYTFLAGKSGLWNNQSAHQFAR